MIQDCGAVGRDYVDGCRAQICQACGPDLQSHIDEFLVSVKVPPAAITVAPVD
jgi:hypothetical protein